MRYLVLVSLSYVITLFLGITFWGDSDTLSKVAQKDASDMLTFYRLAQAEIHLLIALTTAAKSLLLSSLIHFGELFPSAQLLVFLTMKWAIYVFCSMYFIRTFESFVKNSLTRLAIATLTLLNLPVLVHIPQILRDDLITAFFLVTLAALYRAHSQNEESFSLSQPHSSLSSSSWKIYLAIGLVGLYTTRPEFAMLMIALVILGTVKRKRYIVLYLATFGFAGLQIVSLLYSEFGYWLNFLSPTSIFDGSRRLLFSPTPNNVADVFNAGRSHSLAAFWFLFSVPIGAFLSTILVIGLVFTPAGPRLIKSTQFRIFGLIPIVFVVAMSALSFGVQGPRQGLAVSLVLGCLMLALLFGKTRLQNIYEDT